MLSYTVFNKFSLSWWEFLGLLQYNKKYKNIKQIKNKKSKYKYRINNNIKIKNIKTNQQL